MKTIAVIFDFDDTLVPDSTSQFLESRGVDVKWFWNESVKEYIQQGFEPSLAYLNRILDHAGEGKLLGPVTNADLRNFGKTVESTFYPGFAAMFKELQEAALAAWSEISVEYYVVSGGLQDVVEGCPSIAKNMSAVYACQYGEDPVTGNISRVKRCVTFTEKTRYLFEINKGIKPQTAAENPYIVNKDVPAERRRIPFRNMIYIGDGLTDIPCFSLVKRMGGIAFGVFHPAEEKSARRALLEFLHTDRVVSMHAPRYRRTDELGSLLRAAVANVASRIKLEHHEIRTAGGIV